MEFEVGSELKNTNPYYIMLTTVRELKFNWMQRLEAIY